jgi:hypothetical protein
MTTVDPWQPATESGDRPLYAIGGAVGAAVAGILVSVFVVALVQVSMRLLGLSLPTVPRFGLLFLAGGLGLAGTAAGYLAYRGIQVSAYIGSRLPSWRDLLWALGGYIGALSLIFTAGMVLTLVQVQPETTNRAAQAGMENPELLLWLVPLSFLVIAPAEELLFRGVVQGRLREAFRPALAIPATAALFALVHYFSLTGGSGARFIAISILFLPSLVFGYTYERTRNLVVPILIHGAYNSTLIMLVYVSLKVLGEGQMPA